MIEIFILIGLGQSISKMVKAKGLSSGKYVTLMIVLWVGLELLGAVVGNIALGGGIAAYALALMGAIIGGTISYQVAKYAQSKQINTDDILDANIV